VERNQIANGNGGQASLTERALVKGHDGGLSPESSNAAYLLGSVKKSVKREGAAQV
jgi:hypothetical protein